MMKGSRRASARRTDAARLRRPRTKHRNNARCAASWFRRLPEAAQGDRGGARGIAGPLDKTLNARHELATGAEASAGPLHSLTGEVQHVGRARVFLHEGPTTAERVRTMLDVKRMEPFDIKLLHPWRADLLDAAHIGWHGAVDSVDWQPLVDAPVHVKVTVVATYDSDSERAVSAISKRLMWPLTVFRFDDHFPAGFDLTYPWPNHEDWWRTDSREYCGPTLDDLSSSATWATESSRRPRTGRVDPRIGFERSSPPSGTRWSSHRFSFTAVIVTDYSRMTSSTARCGRSPMSKTRRG